MAAYDTATATTSTDQCTVAAIQANLDAAAQQVNVDHNAQANLAVARNFALADLIAAAQAAMLPTP